jgi:hypothetical protein
VYNKGYLYMQWNGISSLKIDCIEAYVEQIIQVFPYSFISTDFFAVMNKKNYVWSFGSWYTSTCDVNCFNFSFNMDYKVSLSFEYINFCLIIYLKLF